MADYTLTAKLTADAKGLQKGFQMAQSSLATMQTKTSTMGKNMQKIGKGISKVGSSLTRKITAPALAATGALTGITLVKGFNRLTGIDTAQAKLKGLGHDGKSVETIMTSALESVKGTSFGMDEAATTAASAVAAGIKPGKELTRYLSLTGDAAAIAGDSLSGMGPIFNKVQTSNKAYNDSLQQLSERGLPIYQWLADEAGVTEDAVFDMASNGEISSEMFLNAVEKNIGGAAQTMGAESFTAGIANIGAAVGRLGANFLDAGGQAGGFFSTIKPMIPEVIGYIDGLADKAADMGVKFGEAFTGFIDRVRDMKASFDNLDPSVQSFLLKAVGIGAAVAVGIGPALKVIGTLTTGFGGVAQVVSLLFSPIGLVVGAVIALGAAFAVAWLKSEEFRNKVSNAFGIVSDIISNVVSFLSPILSTMWDGAKDGVSSFADGLGGKLLSAFDTITGVVMTVVDVIGQFVSSLVVGFKDAGGEVSNLSMLFIGFNPVLKIVMMILKNFGPQIAESFSQIASMAMPMLTLLGQTLGELAAAIIPVVMNTIATLIPIVAQLGTVFMQIISAVLPIVVDLFSQLVPIVMSLVTTVLGLVSQFLPLVAILVDALVPVIMVLIDAFLNIVTAVAPALIAILGAVIAVFQAIIPVVMSVLTVVINVMANVISAITPIIAFIAMVITTIMSIVSPIIVFIAGIMASIFNAIRPIIVFVTGVFNTVFTVISGVFRSVSSFISGVMSTVSSVIARLSGTVSKVFNSIWNTVTKVMTRVSTKIQNVFNAITNAWNGLKSFVSGVFSGIGNSVEILVGQVKGFVNGVTGGINAAIGIINKIPGVSISKIPQLYHGTNNWAGGFAYMNEGGRGELAMLPGGTQVIPHDVSMRYAREAGRQSSYVGAGGVSTVSNENNVTVHAVIRNDKDIDKLANTLDEKLSHLGERRRAAFA
ncbi:tape measure protein [Amphibacillus sp. MSJ-3]|uniref:tape measure protein n=1 Tax=Amphibacillus sp. MSJ-3 TaxID=2841505 RepID=UPI001C0F2260|nr:tape measure protein [Amphibacillus sp. MSJ-3]MBU5594919.1 tape measure protein [Amphibacillus sp. MSJ-3]